MLSKGVVFKERQVIARGQAVNKLNIRIGKEVFLLENEKRRTEARLLCSRWWILRDLNPWPTD